MAQCTHYLRMSNNDPAPGAEALPSVTTQACGLPARPLLFQDPALTWGCFSGRGYMMTSISHISSSFCRLTQVFPEPPSTTEVAFPPRYHYLLFPPASLPQHSRRSPPRPPTPPPTPTWPGVASGNPQAFLQWRWPSPVCPRAASRLRPCMCLPSGQGRGSWWRVL